MRKRLTFFMALCLLATIQPFAQKTYKSTWESIDSRPVPAWFEDAKFGIFIHWGVYSVPSWAITTGSIYGKYAEWYWARLGTLGEKGEKSFVDFHSKMYGDKVKYQDFARDFKAELFNPDQWADILKNAGAKYVVLTSKHHEGFTLWPSAQSTNWNSVDIGPHRDLCGDLSKSVKEKGLHMGFYYSLYEWYNPLYKSNPTKYVDEHMMPQLKDLVTRYQPDVVWTDGEWEQTSDTWKSTQFLSWLYNESPVKNTVVVNDRWGKETRSKHGGIYTTEYDLIHEGDSKGLKFERPWEECRGIGGSFGYNRNENLENYETSEALVHILINKVGRGGNLLLNIGPTADGRIPVIMQQRLADMGAWLKVNGEAIYSSRKWDNAPAVTAKTTVYYTKKGKDLYAIVTKWQDTPLVIEGIGKGVSVSMLGYNGKVKFSSSGKKLTIQPPVLTPANIPCQYAWVFKVANAIK
ncbi:MAG: alpha-L-fucosidase [Bacteroidales bacterium]|nr:alpha-L-fucosidase [Bacteroidales bacterium]